MNKSPEKNPLAPVASVLLDALILLCLALWLMHGLEWNGRRILAHGADLRRGAMVLAAIAALIPPVRERSLALRAARQAARALQMPRWRWRALGFAFFGAFVLVIEQTIALRYPLWDVGLFHQIIWAVSRGHGFVSTISGAGNFLFDHLSPSLALLAPAFQVLDAPFTLPVLHALLIFIGIAAWVRLAEKAPGATPLARATLAAATTVFAIGFNSLWANLHWGFHENAIAFAALSWASCLLFAESSLRPAVRRALAVLLLLIAAGSKEILLLDVALAFAVWAWFCVSRRSAPRAFSGLLLFIAVSLVWVFITFATLPHPEGKNYFIRYYSYLGNSLGEAVSSLPRAPALVLEAIGLKKLGAFILAVFLPWLFLPVIAPYLKRFAAPASEAPQSQPSRGPLAPISPAWLLAAAPSFASMALSTYDPLRDPRFHYALELWPWLAALTIVTLAQINRVRLIWAWAILSLFLLSADPWQDYLAYRRETGERVQLVEKLRTLPPEASVAADEMTGAWLASRLEITRFPDLSAWDGRCPEWFVLTERAAQGLEHGGLAAHEVYARCREREGAPPEQRALPNPVWTTDGWVAYKLK